MSASPDFFVRDGRRYRPLRPDTVGWPSPGLYFVWQGYRQVVPATPSVLSMLTPAVAQDVAALEPYREAWCDAFLGPDRSAHRRSLPEHLAVGPLFQDGRPAAIARAAECLLEAARLVRPALLAQHASMMDTIAARRARPVRLAIPSDPPDGTLIFRRAGRRYEVAGESFHRFPEAGVWWVAPGAIFRWTQLRRLGDPPPPMAVEPLAARRAALSAAIQQVHAAWMTCVQEAVTTRHSARWLAPNDFARHLIAAATGLPLALRS